MELTRLRKNIGGHDFEVEVGIIGGSLGEQIIMDGETVDVIAGKVRRKIHIVWNATPEQAQEIEDLILKARAEATK